MEQTIQALAGQADKLPFNLMTLEKMISVLSGQDQDNNVLSGAEETDCHTLLPFCQLLKQQIIAQLNKNKSPDKNALAEEQEWFLGEINKIEQSELIMIRLATPSESDQAAKDNPDADNVIGNQALPLTVISFCPISPTEIIIINQPLNNDGLLSPAKTVAGKENKGVGESSALLKGVLPAPPAEVQNNNSRTASFAVPVREAAPINKFLVTAPYDETELKAGFEKSLAVKTESDEGKIKEAPMEKYPLDKGHAGGDGKLLRENNAGLFATADERTKTAGNGKSLPESRTQLPPDEAERLSFGNQGKEKTENEKSGRISENHSPKKDFMPESVCLTVQEKKSAGGNDFISRAFVFSNFGKQGLEERKSASEESPKFDSEEGRDRFFARDNAVMKSEKQKNSSSVAPPAGHKMAKMEEAIQAHRLDGGEKNKIDSKNKIGQTEKNGEAPSAASLSAGATVPSRTQSTAQVSSSDLVHQVACEIKEKANNEGGRVRMVLNPPSLGTLEMDVLVVNSKVKVVLTANNKDLQQTLHGQLDNLKATLQNSGLTVERCDVLMRDRQDEYYRFFGDSAYFQERSARDGEKKKSGSDEREAPSGAYVEKRKAIVGKVTGTEQISLFA